MSDLPTQIGKYRIIRELGRGATATVYLAQSPTYPEPVALKYIRFADKSKDEAKWNRRLLKLLKAEKSVASRLDHPHIIRIFEGVVENDEAYVVMEYFPGESLERYCSFAKLLPVHHFLVTFTVPEELRRVLRAHQRDGYTAIFNAGSETIRDLGASSKYLAGCQLGYFGVLHTWGRDPMIYHPHVHFVVPGGGLNHAEGRWQSTPENP